MRKLLGVFYTFIFQPKPTVEEKQLSKGELIGFVAMLLLLAFLGVTVFL